MSHVKYISVKNQKKREGKETDCHGLKGKIGKEVCL